MTAHNLPIHNSIRILLINQHKQILLICADDPSTKIHGQKYKGKFWFTVGGKIEEGEDVAATVIREIYEETGLSAEAITLGPIVWYGEFDLELSGVLQRLKQRFMVVHTNQTKLTIANLTAAEKKVIKELRWFSLDEIKNCQDMIYPSKLAEYLPEILQGNYPSSPIKRDLL